MRRRLSHRRDHSRTPSGTPEAPRVGLFGLYGSGNIGNDASLEAMVELVTTELPHARLECLCPGPAQVSERHGIAATALHWSPTSRWSRLLPPAVWKALGKLADTGRILRWVRGHDMVLVPGTGVFETTLPLRPWGFPYTLFVLCCGARRAGTRVALVNVGANVTGRRLTRLLFVASTRMAHYRSFRDQGSRRALAAMGCDVSDADVYPDLAFALAGPEHGAGEVAAEPGSVGVGVMDFHGGNDDRSAADLIHESYVYAMRTFVRWLVSRGHRVHLFTGDAVDEDTAEYIRARVTDERPADESAGIGAVVTRRCATFQELQRHMAVVDAVVATRHHNVLCALKLAKPVLSVSYATKSDEALAQWGLARFCHPARDIDVDGLIEQFTELQRHAPELRAAMAATATRQAGLLRRQSAVLCGALRGAQPGNGTQTPTTREKTCEPHH